MSFAGNPSLKNTPLSPAAQSLGLGDALQTQLQNQLDETAKKKKAEQQANAVGALNPNTTGRCACSAVFSAVADWTGDSYSSAWCSSASTRDFFVGG